MTTQELAGHRALVTGGTAGIGLEAARLLAADLSDVESVRSLVAQYGEVDVIVNNAAAFPGVLTVDQDLASFVRTFDTNVRGADFLVGALVSGMLERGGGSIVNVTSMVAFKGVAGASTYTASKAAVESLTRTWAAEFGPRGVRVNSVAHCRWGARRSRGRSPRPSCSRPHRGPVSSPGRRCTPTAVEWRHE